MQHPPPPVQSYVYSSLSRTLRAQFRQESVSEPPSEWLAEVLTCHLLDGLRQEEVGDTEIESLVTLLTPQEVGAAVRPFTAQQPALSGIPGTSTVIGTALGKIVQNVLLALVDGGEKFVKRTISFCRALRLQMQRDYSCPISKAAQEQVQMILDCTMLLADQSQVPESITALEKIWKTKADGPKKMLKLAFSQNAYYRAQETWLRSSWSAAVALHPTVQALTKAMETGDLVAVGKFVDEMPSSRAAFRPGHAKSI